MKKGDKVMIYEKPITREKPEGEARLVSLLSTDTFFDGKEQCQAELWHVRFPHERSLYTRLIRV